jgi:hypothetical protein
MATSATVVDTSSFSTDAKFRTWGQAVSTAIVAGGLTATSDTGQINWSTVARPTTTATKAGYEIYRFNDSLQGSYPVYIRIDYGTGTATVGTNPSTWLTVGTGSDGAGNITGITTGVLANQSATTPSSNTTTPIKACTTSGYTLIAAGNITGNLSAGFWVVSRTCDAAGAITGDGVVVYYSSTTASVLVTAHLGFKVATLFSTGAVPAVSLVSGSSPSSGGVVYLYKNYVLLGGIYNTQGVLTYRTGDITADTTFTASPWGVTHTYYAMPVTMAAGIEPGQSTNFLAAVIWE